ncbi:hypothetical protein BGZ83_002298 [Gryganskiella cystojenkinii]|nr:hypothetical protein BGZ83_002298 [Gryganskiella cystojenkinii]
MRAVSTYQKGGALKVVSNRSFADILQGKQNHNTQEQKHQETQSKERQEQQSNAKKQEQHHHQAIDKKLKEQSDTIIRLTEEMRTMREQNSTLMQLFIIVVSQTSGINIPPELLKTAGLSTDIARNKMNQRTGSQKSDTPSTNESIAGINKIITERQQHKPHIDPPMNPNHNNKGKQPKHSSNE